MNAWYLVHQRWNSLLDHIASFWYKIPLGKVGKGTVIRRHVRIEGNALDCVTIGEQCVIDTHAVISCSRRAHTENGLIEPTLKMGNNCAIGQFTHVTAVNKVVIGDNLLTVRFVLISDNSHGEMTLNDVTKGPLARKIVSKGPVTIGNNVWLGDKVSVLPGVTIGDGCVVGANSVVTHDIPSYSVAAGNPAKVIKTITQ